MHNSSNVTPKDQAMMATLTAMELIHSGKLDLLHEEADTPTFKRAARNCLAILHNRMLKKSGFDGVDLPIE